MYLFLTHIFTTCGTVELFIVYNTKQISTRISKPFGNVEYHENEVYNIYLYAKMFRQ